MKADTVLGRMAAETKTDYWNDSCAEDELKYAIENGATGATSNPIIVGNVFVKERDYWAQYIRDLMEQKNDYSEVDILWDISEKMAIRGAEMLSEVFIREKKLKGRISIQINPQNYLNSEKMVQQARYFDSLAENIQVKIPVSSAGISAIEEATYHGVNVNATVCFSVPQAVQVGEAIERGMKRREAEGKDTSIMSPVCTIMAGRSDDWFKLACERDGILVDPECLEWGGVAIIKHAYKIYQEKGFRTRLLIAAFRNHYHMSEFMGGDIAATIPHGWQKRFNSSRIEVKDRMNNHVDSEILQELLSQVPDFRRMYEPDGMSAVDFNTLGPQVITLRDFHEGYFKLITMIREVMLPDPS